MVHLFSGSSSVVTS